MILDGMTLKEHHAKQTDIGIAFSLVNTILALQDKRNRKCGACESNIILSGEPNE